MRHIADQLEVAGGLRVDHHRALDRCVADAKGAGGEADVELELCMLEERACC